MEETDRNGHIVSRRYSDWEGIGDISKEQAAAIRAQRRGYKGVDMPKDQQKKLIKQAKKTEAEYNKGLKAAKKKAKEDSKRGTKR
jgi:hypothetical protein